MCLDTFSYLLGKKKGGGGGEPNLQTKSVTITSNTTTEVTPDTGYDGLSQVNITTNVSGGGSSHDWQMIGYSDEPSSIGDAYDYALEIKNNWNSSQTSLQDKFRNDLNLVVMPLVDTSNVTSMSGTFRGCPSLFDLPLLNTSAVTNMGEMFRECKRLKTIPLFDTSNVTNFGYMFYECQLLENLPLLDTSGATNLASIFYHVGKSLTDTSLDNILKMCINATSYAGTKSLASLGMASSYVSQAKWESLPSYQAFLDAGWITY